MELDHYHWINDADLLSVGELAEIARSVWEPRRGFKKAGAKL
jgi:hypothetical protein